MQPKSYDRLALEEQLRMKVKEAHEQYKVAGAHYRNVLDQQKLGSLPSPDGALALHQAHAQESAALNHYRRTLREFTDLVLRGKIVL